MLVDFADGGAFNGPNVPVVTLPPPAAPELIADVGMTSLSKCMSVMLSSVTGQRNLMIQVVIVGTRHSHKRDWAGH